MPDTGDLVHRNKFKLQKLGERRGREAKQMRSRHWSPKMTRSLSTAVRVACSPPSSSTRVSHVFIFPSPPPAPLPCASHERLCTGPEAKWGFDRARTIRRLCRPPPWPPASPSTAHASTSPRSDADRVSCVTGCRLARRSSHAAACECSQHTLMTVAHSTTCCSWSPYVPVCPRCL
jgi:hypothetical protein